MRLLIGFTIILFMVTFLSDAFAQFDTGTTTKTDILESNENDEIEVKSDFESSTTGAWKLPSGTEAQRPDPADSGMIRYNSEEGTFEGYVVDLWGPIAGSGGLSKFEASFDYDAGDYIEEDNKVFRANADFTSGATFDPANWTLISPVRIDGDLAFLESDEIELRSQKLLLDGNGNTDDTGRVDNLFPDPRFYKRNNQGTCTGCSFLDFSGVLDADVFIGDNALGVFFTTATGEAVFDFPVRASQQGKQGILDLQIKVKQGDDYKLDITRGTNVIETLDISAGADGYLRYSYYFVLGTSVGFNIRNTESVAAGDTVIIDDVYLGASRLPILPTKNCTDGLDCENVFSAFYDSDETTLADAVKDQAPSTFITNTAKSGTDDFMKTFTVPDGIFSQAPKCVTSGGLGNKGADYIKSSSSATSLVFETRVKSNTGLRDAPFSFACFKHPDDYKPITQQGVITKEGSAGANLTITNEGTTTGVAIGNATITIPFDTIKDSRFISWSTADNEATFLKGGKFRLDLYTIVDSGSDNSTVSRFLEMDRGSGYSALTPDDSSCAAITSSVNRVPEQTCPFVFNAKKGDKLRARASGTHSSTSLINSSGRYPKLTIHSIVDTESIHAEIANKLEYGEKGKTYTTCVIRQTTESTTAIFESVPEGCADFSGASRTLEGTYGGLAFSSGFYKPMSEVQCSTGSIKSTTRVDTISIYDAGTDGFIVENATFVAANRSAAGAARDGAWNLICHGQKP